MARRPKATPTTVDPAPVAKEQVPGVSGALGGSRRGRKAKAAASAAPVDLAESGAMAAEEPDADTRNIEAAATPVRGRLGRKPKQQAEAAAPLRGRAKPAKTQRGRKPRATEPETAGNDAPVPPATAQGEGMRRDAAAAPHADPGAPVPSKSAAQWDQATDTVRFNWSEIEQTASKEGPNQGMAKLLIAARAEGANSRWPL